MRRCVRALVGARGGTGTGAGTERNFRREGDFVAC